MRVEMISDPEITPFGDLRRLLCEKNPFSVPQARMVEKVLRGKKETSESKDFNQLLSANNIPMSIEDLPIEDLMYARDGYAAPGAVFRLTESDLVAKLEKLIHCYQSDFDIRESAGIHQIFQRSDIEPMQLLADHYQEARKGVAA
jgi:hypothetical protein